MSGIESVRPIIDIAKKRRSNLKPLRLAKPEDPVVVPFRNLTTQPKVPNGVRRNLQVSCQDRVAAKRVDHGINRAERFNSHVIHALTKSHNVIGVKGMNAESRKSLVKHTISRMPRPSGEALVDDVAFRLKVSRLALDKSQTDVAKALNILPHRWSQWENARTLPAIPIMAKFADRYGISLDWIYRGRAETMATGLADKIIQISDDLLAADITRRRA